jgi:trigger factor
LDSRSSFIELEREAKEGDIVDIDHEIIVDEKAQEELKAINYKFIVGKEQTYLELNTGVIGMKKGETKEIEISFSETFYIEALKNKKGIMKVTLNKILERKTPELNDEFVKKLGQFENVEAFKTSISDGILKEKEAREEERIKMLILENIRKTITTEVPEVLIDRESNRMIEDIKYKISEMGMEFEAYLKQANKTEEDIKKDIHEEAKNKVIDALILREIIKIEKLDATPEEIENKTQEILNELSSQNPNIHDADKNMIRNYSEEIIKNEKVFNFLMNIS